MGEVAPHLRRTAAVPGIAAVLIVGVLLYGAVQAAPAPSAAGGLRVPAGRVAASATPTPGPETPADTPTPSPTPHFPVVFENREGNCAIVQSPAGGAWPLLILLGLLALRRARERGRAARAPGLTESTRTGTGG